MTEAEALTKWCPFARVDSTASNLSDARGFQAAKDPCCIGSACMAWRSTVIKVYVPSTDAAFGHEAERTTGFCGLAGAPQ